ncbi:class II fructose-bisphosphatase [Inquilinus limosus]|uniref:class II fructose-bisphosphatase n=1 Tax=Inquilinus limosus TaxID=171674 RepID=UPI000691870B|nr:class II fructose-bisphosphatase [Inquilinus limosus]
MTGAAITEDGFIYALRRVTEAAARAAFDWIGRGRKDEGDAAAVDAMRTVLNHLDIDGRIVIGEGEKDEAPQLYKGERLGRGTGQAVDIAVDPVDGTSHLANGQTNALAAVAMTPQGAMFDPGPAFYMEKFAGPPAVKGRIDPLAPTRDKLKVLAQALGKPVSDLSVYVLEKPRHRRLVEEIHAAGARVALYPAGDVAGAIVAAMPGGEVDCLMGTGGTPEGVLAACAIRALGGEFLGRLDPQLEHERAAVAHAGLDTRRWWGVEELVRSDKVWFAATGITTGLLFEGVSRRGPSTRTQSLMLTAPDRQWQVLTTYVETALLGPGPGQAQEAMR